MFSSFVVVFVVSSSNPSFRSLRPHSQRRLRWKSAARRLPLIANRDGRLSHCPFRTLVLWLVGSFWLVGTSTFPVRLSMFSPSNLSLKVEQLGVWKHKSSISSDFDRIWENSKDLNFSLKPSFLPQPGQAQRVTTEEQRLRSSLAQAGWLERDKLTIPDDGWSQMSLMSLWN